MSSSCLENSRTIESVSVAIETISKPCCKRFLDWAPDMPKSTVSRYMTGSPPPTADLQKMAAFLPLSLHALRVRAIAASCSSPPNSMSIDLARSKGPTQITMNI